MRRLSFYLRLAGQNLVKNHRFYLPYILCCIGTAGMFYIMSFLTQDKMIGDMPGAEYVQSVMWLGVVVIAIFSVFIMLYTNSFIMKRRQRELGLYNILGMEKRHIAILMLFETLILACCGIAGGLLMGMLFSKLMILILAQVLRFGVPMGFSVNEGAVSLTAIWFLAVFAVCLLRNIGGVLRASPIELLHSSARGEREPKTKWLLALGGVAALGGGYGIALTVKDPINALAFFFVAVILVIIGTYCLFTAGSVALLKGLRRNKKFYYRTGPFTAVSGLIYRMKQNAFGLANICILSTMVLVTISSTVCLYVGIDDIVKEQSPYDIEIDLQTQDREKQDTVAQVIRDSAEKVGVSVEQENRFDYLQFSGKWTGQDYALVTGTMSELEYAVEFGIITAEGYNALHSQEPVTLEKGEALVYGSPAYTADTLTIGGKTFKVKSQLEDYPILKGAAMIVMSRSVGMVVSDEETLQEIWQMQADAYKENRSDIKHVIGVDVDGAAGQKVDCYLAVRDWLNEHKWEEYGFRALSRQINLDESYQFYGSFLFLGIFLGTVFMMAAVLIIYYKQVSEGYEDRERFVIMQKVGMDARTVKRSIHSQVLMVFFLPLITAGIHIAFAFPMISKMLRLFALHNTALFASCTVITLLIFSAIYILVYSMTAKTYYKIVKG